MRRLWRQAGWWLVVAGGVVGCATAPPRADRASCEVGPNLGAAGGLPAAEVAVPSVVQVPEPLRIAPAAPLAPAGSVTGADSGLKLEDWISLELWSTDNGYGRPVASRNATGLVFTVRTPQATVTLQMGNPWAWCDGYACSLGFAPRLIRGLPHVHLLDGLKTLRPLLDRSARSGLTQRSIIIDPGHGGRDSGARNSFSGGWEKDLTLDWALRLGRLLAGRGWRVYLTRTNDLTLGPAERVGLAESSQAALFLSLHFNAVAGNPGLAGIETYYLTPAGLPSTLVRDEPDDPGQVYPNNAFDETNLCVAFELHRAVVRRSGAPDRGVRRARFLGVLRWQHRPAVLIEGGYLSNLAEARRIASADYRQALAQALADALDGLGPADLPTASVPPAGPALACGFQP